MVLNLMLDYKFIINRATHKGRDCKDDLKLLKYDESKV